MTALARPSRVQGSHDGSDGCEPASRDEHHGTWAIGNPDRSVLLLVTVSPPDLREDRISTGPKRNGS